MKRVLIVGAQALLLVGLLIWEDYYREYITVQPWRRLMSISIQFTIAWLILLLARKLIFIGYRKRKNIPSWGQDNFIIGIQQLSDLVMFILVLFVVLRLFSINVKQFLTSLSIFAAALALLSKDYISNVISGMIIAFSNRLSIGDHVKIHEHEGKIVDITLTSIHLLNDDDDIAYVPNATAFSTEIINFTKGDVRKTSIEMEVDYKHLSSINDLEAKLIETLRPHMEFVREETIRLKVLEIHHEYAVLKFQYLLKQADRNKEREIRRAMKRKIVDVIKEGH